MCGIYLTNIPYEKNIVEKKISLITFRGPDNMGFSKINNISLAHLRLSIIDLDSRSNQPMQFENLHIVYNGEIYNFVSIKEELKGLGCQFTTTSDTEVLLIGYKKWGADLVPKLNGMFSFGIYNTDTQEIFCARDRLGVKPFYYYWKNGYFEICSQLRPLSEGKEISSEAISIYLDCGYIPSPYSIFNDVYKLPPGNTMIIDLNTYQINVKEYWNLKKVVLTDISYKDAKKQLHDLLIDAVKIRLRSDVPLGSFLSGGIDSALISAIASKISTKPINTFTIGFEDPKYDESKVASQFAEIIGSNHKETKCSPDDALKMITKFIEVYDEPFADSSALPSLLLNSVTKQFATVALSGDGGDESFLGYNHFDSVAAFSKLNKAPSWVKSAILFLVNLNVFGNRGKHWKSILEVKTVNGFIEAIFTGYDSLQKIRNLTWLLQYRNYKDLSTNNIQKAADLNIKLWLENDSNVKVDRASMAYSVEVRSPFLDYRIVEFARALPVNYRFRKGKRKRILRDILKEYIPERIFDQPKKGFSVPLGKWIRENLKEDVFKELNNDFLNKVPNLDVEKIKSQLNMHFVGSYDHSFNIWKLYVLAKWYKEFKL